MRKSAESSARETPQHSRLIQSPPVNTPWLDGRVPNGFWDIRQNRVEYMRWLAVRCGFHAPEDWYSVRKLHFHQNHGGGLLHNSYRCSVHIAVADYLPDYDWKQWLFGGAPNKFWQVRENRCAYMDWLGVQLQFRQPEDWYEARRHHFAEYHGGGLLRNIYRSSVYDAVTDYLPEFDWKPWLFGSVPQSFWHCIENRRKFLQWLGPRIGFQGPEDWLALKREHFVGNGGAGLFAEVYRGSTRTAVMEISPVLNIASA